MEIDIRVMIDMTKQIEKGRVNFKKSPKERITEFYINTRLEALEVLFHQFTKRHETIISSYEEEALTKSLYISKDIFNVGYETYLDYKGELKHALSKFKITPATEYSDSPKLSGGSILKLPKISIPIFSGNYTEWSSFRDLFVSLVHNNPALDDVQRLHYLKTQVTGEAERLIKHLPITQSNYRKCWELLQSRYNNKRFMSNFILKRFFNQRSMNVESASSIKDLLDTTCDCLHELSNLGINIGTWDVMIIYIIGLKLDVETRKQWELHISQSGDNLPTFQMFKEFLESRFRALEFVEPSSRNRSKVNQSHVASNTIVYPNFNESCPHCTENHKIYNCKQFSQKDVDQRRELVKALGLCFNCLNSNHSGKQCRNKTTCRVCQKRHHTLLHPKKVSVAAVATATDPTSEEENDSHPEDEYDSDTQVQATDIKAHFLTGTVRSQTLLATALVKAESKNGRPLILRALLDQGSQASFISEAAVQFLRLRKLSSKSYISGIGGSNGELTSKSVVLVKIQSLCEPSFQCQVKAHVLSTVTSVLPEKEFSLQNWSDISNLTLADPQYHTPNKIDILLGAEVYGNILKEGLIKHPKGSMIAQNTHLGWILSGQVGDQNQRGKNILSMHVQADEMDILKRFWEIESEPTLQNKILSPEEQACEDHFAKTVCRDDSGRYIVELPFRSVEPSCEYGNTRNIAVNRLLGLEKRLHKNNQYKQYSEVLNEYLESGHMEQVLDERGTGHFWLPHHAVIRMDKTTTKTRVVFNASSKGTKGVSLNDTLLIGPTLQPELRHIVMRWRLHAICLTADIIKMYRQIKVADKHVDFQRLVWREDSRAEIKDYRLLRVTFGMSCSPYLAVKSLQQVLIDEGENYPLAASRVLSDYYMDDLMTGCNSETEAIKIYEEMNALLGKAGFILQKWSSNSFELLAKLKIENGKDLEIKLDEISKILGLTWNRRTDEFNYTVKLSALSSSGPETKRLIISEISRLYDPLGWIAPCLISAKVFIQKLWVAGVGWDDDLPKHLLDEWHVYREQLINLVDFHIPRWLGQSPSDVLVELHGFSDASTTAYAAVVYMRIVKADGQVTTQLVTAKTKVAPIKQISIPRLELCGAVLAAKLLKEVAMVLNILPANLHAWTDSTIVLAWLCDHPSRWKTFIANRTSDILSIMDSSQWSYVQSKDNPSDCASRGLTAVELLQSRLWKEGPDWLKNANIEYKKPNSIWTKTELEAKRIKALITKTNIDKHYLPWSKYSSLRKLIRVVAYCRRFLRLKKPVQTRPKPLPYLTASELKESLKCCVRYFQNYCYGQNPSHRRNNLITLSPFKDAEGLMRVGGRISNSFLSEDSKHPLIIPHDSHLAKLIVKEGHERTLHGGQQLTINYIRAKYWIPKLKNLVRSHIHDCISCIRYAAVSKTQLMGQLPKCRVTPSKPFLCSGVDYAGPINMRVSKGRGQRSFKGYICLFVCMVTKAVHIEAVSDLTTEGFLAAFKRFVARRGRCNQIWSDNGTNFIGASRELKRLFIGERSTLLSEIANVLANNGTDWHFIPPHAPNFGGLWEAGIKSTKHHLKRVLGDSTLTFEEMSTVLSQIEACLNSRPLSQLSTNSDDDIPLTPGHFLIGEPLLIAPDGSYEQEPFGHLRRWQLTQKMIQHFWQRWSQEYLTGLFQRYKWNTRIPEPNIGQIVLVREDNLPPAKWLYGRVVDIHPGKDNITRVVTLRCKGSVIKRPTSKLCILPVAKE